MKIQWIHMSDLHFGDDEAVETATMRNRLPAYLSGLNLNCDYFFCTGDIREHTKAYTDDTKDYLGRLIKAVHASKECFFAVPGNHDIDIKCDGRDTLIDRITNWHSDYYSSAVGTIQEEDMKSLCAGRADYEAFIRTIHPNQSLSECLPHYSIETDKLNILHVDSTLTYGSSIKRDFIIGTGALAKALRTLNRNKPTVLLTHYSFDYLEQKERNQVEQLLFDYGVELWLAGHEHENLCRRQRDKFYEFQCGNLALQKGARSSFLIGELDLDTGIGEITVHAWFPQSGWALYPFARTNSENNAVYPFSVRLPGKEHRAVGVSRELQSARDAFARHETEGDAFYGLKLKKEIFPDLDCGTEKLSSDATRCSLQKVLTAMWQVKSTDSAKSCNGLLLGDGGMGKSTLLYYSCKESLFSEQKLSVYIPLQFLESTEESLTQYVLRTVYRSVDDAAKNRLIRLVSKRHSTPDLILYIDGFNELSRSKAGAYISEIRKFSGYEGVQLVVSSRLDFLKEFGLSHFWMVRTCLLRDEQLADLFSDNQTEWENIRARKELKVLLQNPMMALLYANTCPIMQRFSDSEMITWVNPIQNESDLLFDFYLSQVAKQIESREAAKNLILSVALTEHILPKLGYLAQNSNVMFWDEGQFDELLEKTTKTFLVECHEKLPPRLKKLKRQNGIGPEVLDSDDIYSFCINDLCLLKHGQGNVTFPHQVFRDYLSAVYLHGLLHKDANSEPWKAKQIPVGVVRYLSHMEGENFWQKGGLAELILEPYRGIDSNDYFLQNIVDCWLTVRNSVTRDLSRLDLRKVSLSEQLKSKVFGIINIDGAQVSKHTFVNETKHDSIIGMAFSHDERILAAVSENGYVSVANIFTQKQRIIGRISIDGNTEIGFDAEDYLVVKSGRRTLRWATISFDYYEEASTSTIERVSLADEQRSIINKFYKRLSDSELMGISTVVSDKGTMLAIGFESGYIQIWNVSNEECISHLSMGDSTISTVSFEKDGKYVALGAGGKIVQIIDLEQRMCIRTLHFDKRVSKVQFPMQDIRAVSSTPYLICQYADGSYHKLNFNSMEDRVLPRRSSGLISRELTRAISSMKNREVKSANNGNAIVLNKEDGQAYTWDQSRKMLNQCKGHKSEVLHIAICADADSRFAASYSGERFTPERGDKNGRMLNGKKIVRIRIVKIGQCQWRLPTDGRELQSFNSLRQTELF